MREISTEELLTKGKPIASGQAMGTEPTASGLGEGGISTETLLAEGKPLTVNAAPTPAGGAAPSSFVGQLGRQVGLFGRAAVQGVTDPVLALNDLALQYIQNPITRAMGLGEAGSSMQTRDSLLNEVLPQPATAGERVVNQAIRAGFSTVLPIKGGQAMTRSPNPTTAAIGQTMAAQPGAQVVGAATGGGAAETAREVFDVNNPYALLGINIAGSLFGGGVASRAANVQTPDWMRNTLGISNPVAGQNFADPRVGQTVQAARAQGVNLTAAEAAPGSRSGQAITALRKAGDVVDDRAQTLTGQVTNMIENKTNAAAPASVSSQSADRAVAADLRTQYNANKATAAKMYDAVETNLKAMPGSEIIPLPNTANAASSLLADFPDFTQLTGAAKSTLRQIEQVGDAAAGRTLKFNEVRKINTQVGNLVESTRGVPGKEEIHGALKNLYANLQNDIDNWASTTTNKAAADAYVNAKQYFTQNVAPYRENSAIRNVVSSKIKASDYDKNAEKLTERILSNGVETTTLATRLLSPEGNSAFRFRIMETARERGINPDASTAFSAPGYQRGMNLGRVDTPTPQSVVMGTDPNALASARTTQDIVDMARGTAVTSKAQPRTGVQLLPTANRAASAGVGAGAASLLSLDPTLGAVSGLLAAPVAARTAERILSTRPMTDFLLGQPFQAGAGTVAPLPGLLVDPRNQR